MAGGRNFRATDPLEMACGSGDSRPLPTLSRQAELAEWARDPVEMAGGSGDMRRRQTHSPLEPAGVSGHHDDASR